MGRTVNICARSAPGFHALRPIFLFLPKRSRLLTQHNHLIAKFAP